MDELKRTRVKITDSQLKSEILKFLNSGNGSKSNFYEQARTKFKLEKQRTLRMFDIVHADWSKLKEKTENEALVESVREAQKTCLKSKLEKQIHLQKQIDAIQNDIDRGILEEYVTVSGKLQVVYKIMNAESKAYLRKIMKELYAELNKMEGDYAPAKIEHSGNISNEPINSDERKLRISELKKKLKIDVN